LPGIDHIVILMKENHSYDNYFGMLDRGDGFTLGPDGTPQNSNPDGQGNQVLVHHLSLPFNPSDNLSQTWNASHQHRNNGAMDGWVTAPHRSDPLGYVDGAVLRWSEACAGASVLGARYFSWVLPGPFPNRRFLQAATAAGQVGDDIPNPFTRPPATGLIWDL